MAYLHNGLFIHYATTLKIPKMCIYICTPVDPNDKLHTEIDMFITLYIHNAQSAYNTITVSCLSPFIFGKLTENTFAKPHTNVENFATHQPTTMHPPSPPVHCLPHTPHKSYRNLASSAHTLTHRRVHTHRSRRSAFPSLLRARFGSLLRCRRRRCWQRVTRAAVPLTQNSSRTGRARADARLGYLPRSLSSPSSAFIVALYSSASSLFSRAGREEAAIFADAVECACDDRSVAGVRKREREMFRWWPWLYRGSLEVGEFSGMVGVKKITKL